jgi:hypothetical protein
VKIVAKSGRRKGTPDFINFFAAAATLDSAKIEHLTQKVIFFF